MAERNRKFIGKRIDVLCEGYDTETSCWYGRTYADAPEVDGRIYFITEGDARPRIGDVCRIAVSDSLDYDLMGIMC